MAGRYASAQRPSIVTRGNGPTTPRHAQQARTFAGTPLNVDGVTRDAMSASSLLGSGIPKGPLSFTIAASHGAAANSLTSDQASAQQSITSALSGIDAVSKSRALRSVARNAEGVAPTSTPLSVEAARLLANGRGPRVTVQGMVSGDVARVVAEFDRYGYMVNRAMVPSRLDVMSKRSYWQLEDATLTGQIPQGAREQLAAAFERGVTVWTSVADIGTKPANTPNSGISY